MSALLILLMQAVALCTTLLCCTCIVLWSAVVALLGLWLHKAAPVLLLTAEPFLLCMQILPEERRDIPHHLLDILKPSQDFSAGDFYEAGRAATQAILQVSICRFKDNWRGPRTALSVDSA